MQAVQHFGSPPCLAPITVSFSVTFHVTQRQILAKNTTLRLKTLHPSPKTLRPSLKMPRAHLKTLQARIQTPESKPFSGVFPCTSRTNDTKKTLCPPPALAPNLPLSSLQHSPEKSRPPPLEITLKIAVPKSAAVKKTTDNPPRHSSRFLAWGISQRQSVSLQ